jgi:hypothetical protein
MQYILAVVLLVAAVSVTGEPQKLPSIDYISYGYNIISGNPHASLFDPGFSQAIFQLNYNLGSTSADGKWLLPDHVEAHQVNSCSFDAETHEITGTESYQQALLVDTAVLDGDRSLPTSAMFSASREYSTIRDNTQSKHEIYISSTARCSRYVARYSLLSAVNFTDPFQRFIKELPLTTDDEAAKEIYMDFISVFGTHFLSQMTMGAKLIITSELDELPWTRADQSDIGVKASSALSLLKFSGSTADFTPAQQQAVDMFEQSRRSKTVSYIGSNPPADGKWETWAENAGNMPSPISYVLRPITDLFEVEYFPDISEDNLRKKRANLEAMYSVYCGLMENCGTASADRIPIKMEGTYEDFGSGDALTSCSPGYTLLSCGQQTYTSNDENRRHNSRFIVPSDGTNDTCQCGDPEGGAICSAWCVNGNSIMAVIKGPHVNANTTTDSCGTGKKVSGCYAAAFVDAIPANDGVGCVFQSGNKVLPEPRYITCLTNVTNYEIRSEYGIGEVTAYCSDGNYVLGCAQSRVADSDRNPGYLVTENSFNSCTCNSETGATCFAMCGQFV